eukprot:scaffold170607_cov39-Attheya_sp.AAC.2
MESKEHQQEREREDITLEGTATIPSHHGASPCISKRKRPILVQGRFLDKQVKHGFDQNKRKGLILIIRGISLRQVILSFWSGTGAYSNHS